MVTLKCTHGLPIIGLSCRALRVRATLAKTRSPIDRASAVEPVALPPIVSVERRRVQQHSDVHVYWWGAKGTKGGSDDSCIVRLLPENRDVPVHMNDGPLVRLNTSALRVGRRSVQLLRASNGPPTRFAC